MNKAATATAGFFLVALIGCSSVARTVGQTTTVHGEVRYPDGTGASGVVARVKGVYTAHFFGSPLIPDAVKLLAEERTDGAGHFSCRVPVYDEYFVEVGDPPKSMSGYATVQRAATKELLIIELK